MLTYSIHGPAVELLVAEYLEGELVLVPVPLHRLQGVVSVPSYALV